VTTLATDAPVPEVLLRGGRLLDVFTGDVAPTNVLIGGGRVLGLGAHCGDAPSVVDLDGAIVLPGLIDGHIHLESSLLTPGRFAEATVPHGTTAVVADPHEVANVLGLAGVRWMLDASRPLPLDVYLMAPSCVPASTLDTSGACLGADDVAQMLGWDGVLGLAEVMDVPAVLRRDPRVMDKIALARRLGRPVDGHAPGLRGAALDRYVAAGISSDHECVTAEEAREKLQRGMRLMIREGSTARNLGDLRSVVDAGTVRRCLLVSDDRNAIDLVRDGHLDHLLRQAVGLGIPPVAAVQMVTLNVAEHFGLDRRGAVAPGWQADITIVDDLERFTVQRVLKRGRLVAEGGRLCAALGATPPLPPTMKMAPLERDALRIDAPDGATRVRVIALVPGQVRTATVVMSAEARHGEVVADPGRDVAKLVVVERHTRSGRIGRGLVRGFGLTQGALASSVAHDSHNIVAVGVHDADLLAAIEAVARAGGGLAVSRGAAVRACLPLPFAGLMTDAALPDTIATLGAVHRAARRLGSRLADPFGALSFLALPVIPTLRLTDRGLVDVEAGRLVSLFAA
jgi:adenine deaminase